ncbi:MAG TPA: hypothetical protein VN648_23505, partial [Candidatus Methylomirabilis sp.]|nr:hypothetical protein [Candidatus Methylomirabilis sp.]
MGSKKAPGRAVRSAARASKSPRQTLPSDDFPNQVGQALATFLPSQRWFGGRSRNVNRVRLLDDTAVPGSAGRLALFEIVYLNEAKEIYQIPIAPGGSDSAFAEALDDPQFCLALLEQMRQAGALPGKKGTFRFVPTENFAPILTDAPTEITRLSAEQSNTSVRFGRQAILKIFRKLEMGPNPDYEITEFLTQHAAFRGAPRLAGALFYEPGDSRSMTLAVLQEFVDSPGDAWTVTQDRLTEYYAAVMEGAADGGEPDLAFARTLAGADAKEAERLGRL